MADSITAILYGPIFGKAEAQAVLSYFQSIGDLSSASATNHTMPRPLRPSLP